MDTLGELPAFEFPRDEHATATQNGFIQDFLNDETFPRDVLDFGVDLTFSTPSVFDAEFQIPFNHQPLSFAFELKDVDLEAPRSGFVTPGLRSKFNISASSQAFKESLWLWTPTKGDHGALEQSNLSLPWDSVSTEDEGSIESPINLERVSNTTRGNI